MTTTIEFFRNHIIEAGVLDKERVHHEFVSGMHGRKLDFDTIDTGNSLYNEWIEVVAAYISDKFIKLPEIIVGVANGTNRVALDTARAFNGSIFGAVSEKDYRNSKVLRLAAPTGKLISAMKPEFVAVIEDVGTTGSNAAQVAQRVLDAGAQTVEVINTWQRRPQLERLLESEIPYHSIINEHLPTYLPEDCKLVGPCSDSWKLVSKYFDNNKY